MKSKIILASKSNIRINLLKNTGVPFTSIGSNYDESIIQTEYTKVKQNIQTVKTMVYKLALEKAKNISKDHQEDIVIGCDQVLLFDDRIFLKPKSIKESVSQLKQLSGNIHNLVTGTLCIKNEREVWHYISVQEMKMRKLSDEYIGNYIKSMNDKIFSVLGGYEIETIGINLFEKIGKDLFSIQGISILELLVFLRSEGYIE